MTPTSSAPSITCPRCGATSYHPGDIAAGYCHRCHWWTSDPAGILNDPQVIAWAEEDGAIEPLDPDYLLVVDLAGQVVGRVPKRLPSTRP